MNKKSLGKLTIFLVFSTIFYGCGLGNFNSGLRGGACYWKNQQRFDLSIVKTQNASVFNRKFNVKLEEQSSYDIYVAGDTNRGGYYWKNGVYNYFDGFRVDDVFVENENVYVAGFSFENGLYNACYWKNGQRFELGPGRTTKIFCKDSNVYVIGFWDDGNSLYPCYWVNGKRIPIHDGCLLTGIFVEGSDIYISGYFNDSNNEDHGCYWKNGIRIPLDNNYASDIYVQNSVVYVSGYGEGDNFTISLFVNGSDVYVTGNYLLDNAPNGSYVAPCFWKNGELNTLGPDTTYQTGDAKDIFVIGSDIFLLGFWSSSDGFCYDGIWHNGETTSLLPGPDSLFVVSK